MDCLNSVFFKHFFTTVIRWQKLNFKLSFHIQFCEEKNVKGK